MLKTFSSVIRMSECRSGQGPEKYAVQYLFLAAFSAVDKTVSIRFIKKSYYHLECDESVCPSWTMVNRVVLKKHIDLATAICGVCS